MTANPPPEAPKERVETEEQAVKRVEAGFWRRYNANPELQEKLKGKHRIVLLDLTNGTPHTFHVRDGKIHEVAKSKHPEPDIVISIAKEDLFAIFNGELKALQAYMTGRAKVKASFKDILFAKSLLGW